MVSCAQYSNGDCSDFWKINYAHTYLNPEYSDNLIVQRYHFCGRHSSIYNHVFYGGALREKEKVMFFAVLVEQPNQNASMNMWGGIGYTDDHSNKDMFCFSNGNGESFDALSLLAGAPYKDIAGNIEGENSISVIGNSYSPASDYSYFYFIQYYRAYNTHDFVGDDILFAKINDHFAYAAYFHDSSTYPVSCLNSKYRHQYSMLMTVNLSLSIPHLITFSLLSLICSFFLF